MPTPTRRSPAAQPSRPARIGAAVTVVVGVAAILLGPAWGIAMLVTRTATPPSWPWFALIVVAEAALLVLGWTPRHRVAGAWQSGGYLVGAGPLPVSVLAWGWAATSLAASRVVPFGAATAPYVVVAVASIAVAVSAAVAIGRRAAASGGASDGAADVAPAAARRRSLQPLPRLAFERFRPESRGFALRPSADWIEIPRLDREQSWIDHVLGELDQSHPLADAERAHVGSSLAAALELADRDPQVHVLLGFESWDRPVVVTWRVIDESLLDGVPLATWLTAADRVPAPAAARAITTRSGLAGVAAYRRVDYATPAEGLDDGPARSDFAFARQGEVAVISHEARSVADQRRVLHDVKLLARSLVFRA
ncbi:hypothetical protein [Schumannella sp. 10F1B-5-1]|uniref:hypothetical protein n=1 Tax=Schumannella sp. 10F1B-5-1 TaxID=2590780 RepID=UPI00113147E5|nr:hypothetical protein [Schumannella sp. 10F1B-5-1]TPW71644.1 hypothetical protein FJ658_09835 [Schumannella sp. 10F1B-5-1]